MRRLLLAAVAGVVLPAPVAEARVVLVASGDGAATLVSVTTGRVEARVPVGGRTRGVAVSADGTRGFVGTGQDVVALDVNGRSVLGRVRLPGAPTALALTPAGDRLLVLRQGALDSVDVTNPAAPVVARSYPLGRSRPGALAVSGDGTTALLALDGRRLAVVDLVGGGVRRLRLTGTTGVALPAVGTVGYAVSVTKAGPRLVSVDLATAKLGRATKLRRGTGGGIAILPGGRRAVLGAARDARVTVVVDLPTRRTLARVAAGRGPGFPATDQDGLRIYVADQRGASISVLSALSYKRLAARPLPATSLPNGVAVQGGVAVIRGTDGPDRLTGTRGPDVLEAFAGDDVATGGRSNDRLFGGPGKDRLDGGAANDLVDGQEDDDVLSSGAGDDRLLGGTGSDFADGGTGNDDVDGGEGDDRLDGGDGDDEVLGGPGNDRIVEDGLGNDFLLDGGPGDDVIDGNRGSDARIDGGPGKDTLLGGPGSETIDGGEDDDTIDGGTAGDRIFGRDGNDSIRGDAGRDTISGSEGNDSIDAGSGDDTITGFTGSDVIVAGPGADSVSAGSGNDEVRVADGDADTVNCSTGRDTVYVEQDAPARDRLTACEIVIPIPAEPSTDAPPTSNNVFGTPGDDELFGTPGVDSLFGGDGNDRLNGNEGDDYVDGEDGNDTVRGGPGNDELHGRNDSDTVIGNEGDDDLTGDRGNDVLMGGPGNDTLNGNLDDDTVFGEDGDDRIQAVGGGLDRIICGPGTDVVFADVGDVVEADCEDVRR